MWLLLHFLIYFSPLWNFPSSNKTRVFNTWTMWLILEKYLLFRQYNLSVTFTYYQTGYIKLNYTSWMRQTICIYFFEFTKIFHFLLNRKWDFFHWSLWNGERKVETWDRTPGSFSCVAGIPILLIARWRWHSGNFIIQQWKIPAFH